MKKSVYPSDAVKPLHDKFVWAYLDTDDEDNAKIAVWDINGEGAEETAQMVRDAEANAEADKARKLAASAAKVQIGKAGKLVITLDFSQIGESSQVKIKHKLDYKVPTKRGTRSENTSLDTPMHVGSGGKITLFAEKHDQLFTREEAPIKPRT